MSESKAQQEPSMEEILASIRKIISEDGNDARPQDGASVSDNEAPMSGVGDDDVLELTDVVEDEPVEPEVAAEAVAAEFDEGQMAAFPETEEEPVPPTEEEADGEGLVSDVTAAASSAALARLMDRSEEPAAEPRAQLPIGEGTRTIEDIVRELLRPMLRDWLDQNLPSMVEEIVEREIQKLGRGASRR